MRVRWKHAPETERHKPLYTHLLFYGGLARACGRARRRRRAAPAPARGRAGPGGVQPARGQRAQPRRRPRLGGVLSHVKKRRSTRLVSEQSERDRSYKLKLPT
eukprot:scaffold9670_cov63-Phaeocystis_antarctica.AAC.4